MKGSIKADMARKDGVEKVTRLRWVDFVRPKDGFDCGLRNRAVFCDAEMDEMMLYLDERCKTMER